MPNTIASPAFAVGSGVTVRCYSDRKAATVIKRTARTVTVRYDKQTLLNGGDSGEPDALVFRVGGFCAHVTGRQRWSCEEDPNGRTETFRLTKGGWTHKDGFSLVLGRTPHHDFNF